VMTVEEKSRINKGHVNRLGDRRSSGLIVRQVIRALRCARAHRVESLAPSAFLQAAAETGAYLPALLRGYILWCIRSDSPQQSDAQSLILELSGLLKAPTRAAFMEHNCICGSPFSQNAQLGNIIPYPCNDLRGVVQTIKKLPAKRFCVLTSFVRVDA
jgi:hypothetical protein